MMTEMGKLDEMLTARGIEHIYNHNFQGGTQIIVFERGQRAWDAVCTPYSYGGKDGLLEIMAENLPFKVQWYLSAAQVMEMAYP